MYHRLTRLYAIPAVLALLTVSAGATSAATVKGTVLQARTVIGGVTGECVCDQQWYTFGLRAGPATVIATLKNQTEQGQFSYGLQASLYRGKTFLQSGQVACPVGKPCGKTIRFHVRTSHAGVYYVLMHGIGGEGITYSLRVQGRTYQVK